MDVTRWSRINRIITKQKSNHTFIASDTDLTSRDPHRLWRGLLQRRHSCHSLLSADSPQTSSEISYESVTCFQRYRYMISYYRYLTEYNLMGQSTPTLSLWAQCLEPTRTASLQPSSPFVLKSERRDTSLPCHTERERRGRRPRYGPPTRVTTCRVTEADRHAGRYPR